MKNTTKKTLRKAAFPLSILITMGVSAMLSVVVGPSLKNYYKKHKRNLRKQENYK